MNANQIIFVLLGLMLTGGGAYYATADNSSRYEEIEEEYEEDLDGKVYHASLSTKKSLLGHYGTLKPDYDIPYAPYKTNHSHWTNYDLYRPDVPATDTRKRPLLMMIHSGGFILGDKESINMIKICDYFAERGFITATINYRMLELANFKEVLTELKSPETVVKEGIVNAIKDARCALHHLIAQADELNIDTDNIFVGGYSAGGIIALNLAFMEQREVATFLGFDTEAEYEAKYGHLDSGFSSHPVDFSKSIKGVVSIAGGMFDLGHLDKYEKDIDMLLIHGDNDKMVPFECGPPFDKHVHDYEFPIDFIQAEMGIVYEADGRREALTFKSPDVSLVLMEQYIDAFRDWVSPEICGSYAIEEIASDYPSVHCELETLEDESHTLFWEAKGDFHEDNFELICERMEAFLEERVD